MMIQYNEILAQIKLVGYDIWQGVPQIAIGADAADELQRAASSICQSRGQRFVWSMDYDKVAQWLSDNERKGLLLMGSPGNGKSLMLDAVALVLLARCQKVCHKVSAYEITTQKDCHQICRSKFAIVDDIGTETDIVDFGVRKTFVSELIDTMERRSNLVMISTNLDGQSLKRRYGERTLDRIRGNFRIVVFNSKSNR